MPTTDRELPQVVVNKLTQAQYSTATKSQDEFYLVTDAKVESSDIDWTTVREQIYSGTPTKSTVSLTSDVSNYSWLTIEYRREDNAGTTTSVTVRSNIGDTVLYTCAPDGGTFSLYGNKISISGTQITRGTGCAVAFNSGGQAGYGSSNEIKIVAVWGIK